MRSPPPLGAPSERARTLRRPSDWFAEGTTRKREAQKAHRCVECRRSLPTARTPYCGRRCQWKFRGRYFWDAARTFVLFRDRYTCQVCGQRRRARELDVDHIHEIADGGAPLEYSNLQAICRPCHRAKTVRYLRGRRMGRSPASAGASSRDGPEYWLEWFPS